MICGPYFGKGTLSSVKSLCSYWKIWKIGILRLKTAAQFGPHRRTELERVNRTSGALSEIWFTYHIEKSKVIVFSLTRLDPDVAQICTHYYCVYAQGSRKLPAKLSFKLCKNRQSPKNSCSFSEYASHSIQQSFLKHLWAVQSKPTICFTPIYRWKTKTHATYFKSYGNVSNLVPRREILTRSHQKLEPVQTEICFSFISNTSANSNYDFFWRVRAECTCSERVGVHTIPGRDKEPRACLDIVQFVIRNLRLQVARPLQNVVKTFMRPRVNHYCSYP